MLAAYLFAQLESADTIQTKRREIWQTYHSALQDWAEANDILLPVIPEECEQAFHMFYIILPSLEARQNLIAYLREKGIQSVFHYLPLHLSDMGVKFGGKAGDCPVTEDLSDRLLRLPFFNAMNEAEQVEVIEAVTSWKK
jgi:dTDP-4-amino-4,6-dideoxygalactose transaminase